MITRERAYELRRMIEKAAQSLDDGDALDAVELFENWSGDGVAYQKDKRLRYDGKLYKVLQDHTSQEDWPPDVAVSLYVEVAEPGEIPVWKQPTGAHDAYNTGDKVHYPDADGPVYISTVDNNVWVPGVYGWELAE